MMGEASAREQFPESELLLQRGARSDAWLATHDQILEQDRFIDGAYPIFASHGSGAYFWDVDGNRYIDFILGYGPVVLGHADPRITDAVVHELKNGTCISPMWRPIQVELTELLTSVIPGAEMAFLLKTGSDATSAAVRLARIYTGRSKIVRWGYNGWHDWSAPRSTGIPASVRNDVLTFDYNDIDSVRSIFESNAGEIACLIMMPFEVEPPNPGFLQEVRSITHQHGALFILDEMRSGFRMALGGAQQYFGVSADLATYSKAMANGYAISALVGRADILSGLGRTHMASTYYGNSAEMAAAIATISILRDSDALERIWTVGEAFQRGLNALVQEFQLPVEVVGYPPSPFLRFTASDLAKRQAAKEAFYRETTRQGILLHPNHHWFTCASHTDEDIYRSLEACRRGFEAASHQVKRLSVG